MLGPARLLNDVPHFSRAPQGVMWLLLAAMLISFAGCSGCRPETPEQRAARQAAEEAQRRQEEEARKQREEREREFVIEPPISKPSDTELKISRVKPGHWMTVTQSMSSNHRDWGGETTLEVIDRNGAPLPIERTPFVLRSSRPVQLAKGRPRQIENVFFVPQATGTMNVRCTLRERNYGAAVGGRPEISPLTAMASYQYFFVVLAKEPARYTFVKSLNGVRVSQNSHEFGLSQDLLHYQVLLPDISKQIPLPDNPLCWTTIAYILWDEVDPAQLDRERREALVDWLHWGGQLIINGPDSLRLLQNSFLSPHLPATDGGADVISQKDVELLAEFWTRSRDRYPKKLNLTRDWSGIKLHVAEGVSSDEGLAAATGGLLVERQVGRGRIVVSRMQLAERDLLTWSPHFDDLFNAGIMRRPPRIWTPGENLDGRVAPHGDWATAPGHMRDAAYVTHHRLFSRDVHANPDATNYRQVEIADDPGGQVKHLPTDSLPPEVLGGIGAWNDFNATSVAAREALREAAGVRVPPASFVVVCLAVYLTLLVPLNWLFFKALGRVEYAWIAAPLIALASAAAVVHQAQLDIGFVRAQTEIAILEVQGSHPRAHLSRYTALYTSLATTYDVQFDDPTAVAAPFPTRDDYRMIPGQSRTNVELVQAREVTLAGFQVSSASTDMLHSEHMIDLDGPITYRQSGSNRWEVTNRSQFTLDSVAVVKRVDDEVGEPRLVGCWVGDLSPATTTSVSFTPVQGAAFEDDRRKQLDPNEPTLSLEPLFTLALDVRHLAPGETRLVGRVDTVLPGVAVKPAANQVRGAALVVAHLDRASLPLPIPDVNSPLDVMRDSSVVELPSE